MTTRESSGRRAAQGYLRLFVLLAAGIVTSGYFFHRNYAQHYRTKVEHELTAIGELKVNELVQFRRERLADVAVFFKNTSFARLVRRAFDTPPDLKVQGQLREWLGEFLAAGQYDRSFLLDTQGTERMAAPAVAAPVATALKPRVAEALQSGQIVFQDFYRDEQDQRIYLALLVPVHDEMQAGRVLGVVGLRIDPTESLYPMINRWPVPSATAEVKLVRRDGYAALYLNELRTRKGTTLTERVPLAETKRTAVMAVLGREGIVEGIDHSGEPVVGYMRAVPDSPWFIVLRIETAEAYAPVREQLWLTVILVAALLAVLGAGLGLIWRNQRADYYREKAEVAEALRKSENRFRNLFDSSRDAIMTLEPPSWKFTSGNPATVAMFGARNAEHFVTSGSWELSPEQQPDGRASAEKAREMIETAMREGSYFFEWTHRRIDGETFPATVLLSRMELAGKVFLQATVRDITERKQAEAARRESEEHYRTLIENLGEGIGHVSANEQFTFVNPAAADIFGVPPGGMLGRSLREFTAPDQFDRIREQTRKRQAGEKSAYEIEISRPDGEKRNLLVTAVPQYDRQGKFSGTFGVFRDITKRRLAEEALRHSESSLQAILHSTADGLLAVSDENRMLLANGRFAEMWRIPREMLASRDDTALLQHVLDQLLDPPAFLRKVQELYRSEEESFDTLRFKDGRVFDRLSRPLLEEGKMRGRVWSFRDVTTQRRAEEALRESEAKFRVLSEASITGVVIIRDGRFDYVNPAAAQMAGYSPAELLAAPTMLDFVVEEDRPLLRENLRRRLVGESDRVVSGYRFRKKDGSLAHMEALGSRISLEGRVAIMATFMDVTERKQAEAERERLIGELRQTLAEVKTLGGLLPICAGCKKIRDDQGYWNQVDVYIQKHTDAKFTHGMCPECIKKYYPDLDLP